MLGFLGHDRSMESLCSTSTSYANLLRLAKDGEAIERRLKSSCIDDHRVTGEAEHHSNRTSIWRG